MTDFDARKLRSAFGRFMTGVTVVTSRTQDGTPVGFTANSFTSVSMDPPLLLVCPGRFLSSYRAFAGCERFAVSILAEGQQEAATVFASSKGDRFSQIAHSVDGHGVPLIDGAIAQFSCRTHSATEAGDHLVLIGEVTEFETGEGRGLGYADGAFFGLGLERAARDPSVRRNMCGVIPRYLDQLLLEPTDQGFRLPMIETPARMGLRDALAAHLADRRVTADLGPVYSVYEDQSGNTHYAWILADATAVEASSGLVPVPVADLPVTRFASAALGRMMARYATEAATRDFTLYLGDAEHGDIHTYSERL